MTKHADNRAPVESDTEGTVIDFAHTCANGQSLSERRSRCRGAVKDIARGAAADTCGLNGIARALETSPTTAKKLCDRREPLPLALGDILAASEGDEPGAAEWAEAVLVLCLELVRGRAPITEASIERLQRMVARDAGTFADVLDKALADGVVSKDEARTLVQVARQARRRWDDVVGKLEALL